MRFRPGNGDAGVNGSVDLVGGGSAPGGTVPASRGGSGRPLVIVLAAAVAVGMAVPVAVLTGAAAAPMVDLGDPGAIVRWGLPLVQAVLDVASATTVGLLLTVALVGGSDRHSGLPTVASRYACLSGLIWALAGAVVTVLGFADVAGVRPFSAGFTSQLPTTIWELEALRVDAISAVLAAVVALGAAVIRSRLGLSFLGVLAVVAILPLAWGGHSAEAANHTLAVGSLALHLTGVVIWVGGLLALIALRPVIGPAMGVAVERFSRLAGWCFAIVAISGGLNAWTRIGHLAGLTSPYGLVVLGKSGALVLLGIAGWQQRRTVIPRLRVRPQALGTFTRLATVETIVMGAAIGMAAVLARSAPPAPGNAMHSSDMTATAGAGSTGETWPGGGVAWLAQGVTALLVIVALAAVIDSVIVAVRARMARPSNQPSDRPSEPSSPAL